VEAHIAQRRTDHDLVALHFDGCPRAAGVISEVGTLAAAPESVLRRWLIELEDMAHEAPAHEIRHFRAMPEEAG
jgi:hypothetical protein